MSSDQAIDLTGRNTGNLLIAHGLLRQFDHELVGVNTSLSPTEVRERANLIVIPAANFLFHGFDFGWAADIIEQADLPCLMVGLGAQARSIGAAVDVPEGTKRFIRAVAARTSLIGVRGEFSGSVVASLGVSNFQVTGCPSYYAPFSTAPVQPAPEARLAINGSRDVVVHATDPETMARVERALMAEALKHGADYIYQTELPEITIARGALPDGEEGEAMLRPAIRFYEPVATAPDLRAFWSSHARVFFDVDEWAEHIRRYRFVFGTRFHGNLIALLNGVPATVIAHDSRTLEMCQTQSIPHIRLTDAEPVDIEKAEADFSWTEFHRARASLVPEYGRFLAANGIRHKIAVLSDSPK